MKNFQNPSLQDIEEILKSTKTIAVIGASMKFSRASHSIFKYLQGQGYKVIPVNPNYEEVLGKTCYPTLQEIPEPIDLVDVFRRPDKVMPIAEGAVEISAKTFWMQDYVINHNAAHYALEHGLDVIMNRCIFRDHSLLF